MYLEKKGFCSWSFSFNDLYVWDKSWVERHYEFISENSVMNVSFVEMDLVKKIL